ncbi:MAG TPA: BamA/TamA family outer membrane protein, partial [Polyangiaceae bacterium]
SERYRNYQNVEQSVGGDGRLRGYPPSIQRGEDLVALNLEYRTPSLDLSSVELGGVAFSDAGSAFSGWDEIPLLHSAGLGVRAVFPQLERSGFRLDVAFPLGASERRITRRSVSDYSVQFAFGQAFPVHGVGGLRAPGE